MIDFSLTEEQQALQNMAREFAVKEMRPNAAKYDKGDEFPEAIRLLATGAVRVERLLSQTFPLARIDDAFQAHRLPDSNKVAVIP